MATSKTKTTPKTTALVKWDEEMAAAAVKQKATLKVQGGSKSISFRGGQITMDDAVVGNIMECVILMEVASNEFYEGIYNPDAPTPPSCYSFSDPANEDEPQAYMAPHEEAESPQADNCAECENNVMGSASTGRGKACKNIRKIAVVLPEAISSPEDMAAAEMRLAKIPVTSVKSLAKYAASVADEYQRPLFGVVTRICTAPDPKLQFRVWFELVETIDFDQALYTATKKRAAEAEKELRTPYVKPSEVTARPVRPVGRAAVAMQRQGAKVGGKVASAPVKRR